MELINVVGDQLAKQSVTAVHLLEKLHETLQAASPEDRASLYNRAKTAKKVFDDLCKAVEAWGINTGEPIAGYEVAPGKGQRAWNVGPTELVCALEGFDQTVSAYGLKTPAALEKELGNDILVKTFIAQLVKIEEGPWGLRAKK